jgi:GDP/UDP-N,N'-diacetylbacillosamine 2-epimerase (hydrolysing)
LSRRLLYLTGTRADFGLMLPTLQRLASTPGFELSLCVTGMHLSERFGLTVREVEASGLPIVARIPADADDDSRLGMSRMGARVSQGLVEVLATHRPDLLILLGDRVEMLAAAVPAMLAGVPIAHLCGGERSGTVDDAMRHAISKLAHLHFVATEDARQRLLRMGEEAHRIHVVGTPGLVGIEALANTPRAKLADRFGLEAQQPLAAVLFHPVVQDESLAGDQCRALLDAVKSEGFQAVCLLPNADTGNSRVREAIERFCASNPGFRPVTHLERSDYVSLLAAADLLIGNSSSGIIEAATFGTPVVNVGDRQLNRERNRNVVDTGTSTDEIRNGIRRARMLPRERGHNVYGDGRTDVRVASILSGLTLDTALLKKRTTY